MKYDYMIVGAGLSGSLLCHALIRRGKRLLVLDPGSEHTASRVAAGLFNPLTGPKMTKTWNADVLFDFLHRYYPALERELEIPFFRVGNLYRPFSGYDEQNDWLAKQHAPGYAGYIHKVFTESHPGGDVHDEFGGLSLAKTGCVDTIALLDALRAYIAMRAELVSLRCQMDQIRVDRHGITYGQYKSDQLVFCTGIGQMEEGSWFHWLPIRPLKGELLDIHTDKPLQTLYNRGCFIIPYVENTSRAGSTYWRGDRTENTTEKAKREISTRLRALLKRSFEVVGQQAGVRPTVPDRRPLLGRHPASGPVAVFNGLGTKGVTLAPYYAEQMAHFLEEGGELDSEVNIKRYYSLYYESLVA